MRDMRFVGLSEDGTRLLLVDDDGQQHRLEIDDAVRSAVRPAGSARPDPTGGATAVRRPAPSTDEPQRPDVRPRDVQAFLRAGMTIDEVAERTGWTATKVGLFEPPIRAERDHVAFTAQNLTIAGRGSAPTTVGERVNERLEQRGVVVADIVWDAYRTERGWTIACRFPAGGRSRMATWRFDAPTRSVHPADDEARWLSEDDASADSPVPSSGRGASPEVYDVIAEGGLENGTRQRREPVRPGRIPHATVRDAETEESDPTDEAGHADGDKGPVDLVSVMRERSRRRRTSRSKKPAATRPAGAPEPTDLPTELAGDGAGESVPADTDAPHGTAPAPGRPTVDDLGHDPVTGTADLFGLDDVDYRPAEASAEQADEVEEQPDETSEDTTEGAPKDRNDHADEASVDDVVAETVDEPADEPVAEPADDQGGVPQRPSQARKGRPNVPSWDDIMFGKRPRS